MHVVHAVGYPHDELQVRAWQAPQPELVMVPGLHSPSPSQKLQRPQRQEASQLRDCVPQLPHARVSSAPAAHSPSPAQAP